MCHETGLKTGILFIVIVTKKIAQKSMIPLSAKRNNQGAHLSVDWSSIISILNFFFFFIISAIRQICNELQFNLEYQSSLKKKKKEKKKNFMTRFSHN
ncbi:hypothetical protein PUN28_001950 [Cardiocondyla obscurior]|uniref:Uncharacterized protein n=1 Tax=Cardiocondyla obscurior TaxID=286306 RepID=A0AAW2GRZ2_9HYME